jgi:hypothetical protein
MNNPLTASTWGYDASNGAHGKHNCPGEDEEGKGMGLRKRFVFFDLPFIFVNTQAHAEQYSGKPGVYP